MEPYFGGILLVVGFCFSWVGVAVNTSGMVRYFGSRSTRENCSQFIWSILIDPSFDLHKCEIGKVSVEYLEG